MGKWGGVYIGLDDWGRGQAKLSFAGACSVVVAGGWGGGGGRAVALVLNGVCCVLYCVNFILFFDESIEATSVYF